MWKGVCVSTTGKLSNLTALGLNENSISVLPTELGKLKNLQMLDLR